jgi:hypothetical protein
MPRWTEEARKIQAEVIKERMKNNLNPRRGGLGKPKSVEHRLALSQANAGKVLSDEHKRKIAWASVRRHNPHCVAASYDDLSDMCDTYNQLGNTPFEISEKLNVSLKLVKKVLKGF